MYGNYDNQGRLPQFDLYVGVNKWDSVKFDNASHIVIKEIIHIPVMDNIYVCLVNTDSGTPFISTLEVRHFHNSTYQAESGSLVLYQRLNFGSTTNEIVRLVASHRKLTYMIFQFLRSIRTVGSSFCY